MCLFLSHRSSVEPQLGLSWVGIKVGQKKKKKKRKKEEKEGTPTFDLSIVYVCAHVCVLVCSETDTISIDALDV